MIEVLSFKKSIEYSRGSIVSKQIIRKNIGTITLFAFDEGQSLSEHTTSFDALLQIIDGEAEITIDKKIYIVQDGEMIILPANIPHSVNASKQFKMILTMIKE